MNMLMRSAAFTTDEKRRLRSSIVNRGSIIESGEPSPLKEVEGTDPKMKEGYAADFLMVNYMADDFRAMSGNSPEKFSQQQSDASFSSVQSDSE